MEYIKIVEVSSTEEENHQKLSLAKLELFCGSVFPRTAGRTFNNFWKIFGWVCNRF
jgi:hypothetical protein